MASMLDIVAEARNAATRSWDRARRAAFGSRQTSPDALARVIEADIIPRLLATNAMAGALGRPSGDIPEGFIEQFARAALTEEVGPLLARLEALMAGGVAVEQILLGVLAPAARRLGSWWDEDACDFVDVTMGLWRCQELVHAVSSLVPGIAPVPGQERAALLAPAPGEQHVLGALIVEEFFRRAGWHTASAPAVDHDELLAMVAGRAFDLVGLTLNSDRHLQPLARTIPALRRASRNPDIVILVGGRVFSERPELAQDVGADGTAADGELAVALADTILEQRARQQKRA